MYCSEIRLSKTFRDLKIACSECVTHSLRLEVKDRILSTMAFGHTDAEAGHIVVE